MALASLHNVNLTFGGHPLFDNLSLHLEEGDRCCLLGRNGEGKSTLLKVLAGLQPPDSGERSVGKGVRLGFLGQEVPRTEAVTVADFVISPSLESAQVQLAREFMQRLSLDPEAPWASQSGGTRRRADLARVLASQPDLLLLDEPTNHLDLASILWLEDWVVRQRMSVLFVTHDRSFARRLANRMAELDRGALNRYAMGYDAFMDRQEELRAVEEKQRAHFDKRLAQEEAWIRQGIKARRTRDEGRVRALVRMRQEARDRRNRQGRVSLAIQDNGSASDLVVEAKGASFSWPGKAIVKNLDLRISRGERIGIIGPNGAGKTTLVRLLTGELQPQEGTIRHGRNLEPLYFDQLRTSLDENRSLAENVAGNDDSLVIGGVQKHVLAYLGDFLFSPERARNPVSILSGGEKNRLLLAKLLARPSNLLILDEPSNDLDRDTLDVLEDALAEYPGTLLIISHDRDFLDNTVTSLLIMEDGGVREFVGTWSEYEADRLRKATVEGPASAASTVRPETPASRDAKPVSRARKLGFKEEKELQDLPARIAALEDDIAAIHRQLEDPAFYKQADAAVRTALPERLARQEDALATAYARWEELEGLANP